MQYLSGGPDGDKSYISEKKYSLNKCAGGCGAMKDDCCQAVEKRKESIPLKKGNSIWYQEVSFNGIILAFSLLSLGQSLVGLEP